MATSDFSASDLVGTVIDGRFELHDKLGEGGMGVIYKARQLSMERMVAVKILLRNRRGDAISVERFRHEAYLASRLRHPNAVVIYDFGQSKGDGLLYIAMELLAGENLKQRIQRVGTLPVATAVRILRQTLRPISQAHRMGLIHRDLKPANIFLTTVEGDSDFVKVLDFGVAKLTAVHDGLSDGYQGGLTVAGKIYGTPNYMSPEQIRGKDLDHHSDLYSLGIIFYELLCGRRPFEADTPVDVMMMHLRDDPPPITDFRSDVPDGLSDVVRRSLAKDPAQRYANGEEFLEALEPFRSGGSAEYQAWPSDTVGLAGGADEEFEDIPSVSAAPILSGIGLGDLDDFDDDGLIGDDLIDEKTMLDDSVLDIDSVDSVADDEPNTIFEPNPDADLANAFAEMDAEEPEPALLNPPAAQARPEQHTDGPTEMSVLELGTGDFESMDPSRLVDIPNLAPQPGAQEDHQRPTKPRLTFEGHPGISAISAPQDAQTDPIQQSPEPEATVGSRRRQLASAQPGSAEPVGTGGQVRRGATAFQLPQQGAPTVPAESPKRASLALKISAGIILTAAIGVAAFMVLPNLLKSAPPPSPPSLAMSSAPSGLELFLDGRYLGSTPLNHKLAQASKGHALKILKGSTRYAASLKPVTGATWLFIELGEEKSKEALGSVLVLSEPSGVVVRLKDKKIGKTPLTLLGLRGRSWELVVGPNGSTKRATVKATAAGEATRLRFSGAPPK